jgi:hypothetical protein
VVFWLQLLTAVSATDSGVGSEDLSTAVDPGTMAESASGAEGLAVDADAPAVDAGTGADVLSLEDQIPVSDSGSGTETSVDMQSSLMLTDSGQGTEAAIQVDVAFAVVESATGVDMLDMTASVTISDVLGGADTLTVTYPIFVVQDTGGLLREVIETPGTLSVSDAGLFAEFAWRTKPTSPMIDDLTLPHVQSIIISNPATMSTKKVQGGSLPRRKMIGKLGRTVTIEGWTDQQSEVDALEALVDGVTRVFYPPSGDSFAVLVTGFNPDRTADKRNRRDYYLTLQEV